MSVKNQHDDYVKMKSEWEKNLDFMKSAKAVKDRNNGKTYLPQLSDQEADEYLDYRNRAPVSMLAKRANRGMCGMIGRKEAQVVGVEDKLGFLIEDIDSVGNSLQAYISTTLGSFLSTGRGATLIDVPTVEGKITKLTAEALGVRPRFFFYDEMSIINWRTERINNKDELVLVVLEESTIEMDESDMFSWKVQPQYRVLYLKNNETYMVDLYDHTGVKKTDEPIIPKMNGAFLNRIPIVFHGGIDIQEPPLNDVVDINLHHYQLGADEIWGLRMSALSTPYVFGKNPEDDDFPSYVGPGRVIGSEDKDTKTGFRETSGAGLTVVANKLAKYEETIEKLSIQMATEALNKSATGASIDYSNSTASLSGVSAAMSVEMTQAMRIAVEWAGGSPDEVEVILNMDFVPAGMDANMLAQLLQAYLSGAISYETFYRNLAKGEITDPHKDPEDEKREIDENLPPSLDSDLSDIDDDDEDDDE